MRKRILALILSVITLFSITACGNTQKAEELNESPAPIEGTETQDSGYIEYVPPALSLSTDTWTIPAGSSATVTFTVTGADTAELYCENKKVADFQDGVATLTLSSDVRTHSTYYAVYGDDKSNEVSVSFFKEETQEEIDTTSAFISSVKDAYSEYAPAENPTAEELIAAAKATEAVLTEGVNNGTVANYTPESNGYTITFTNGIVRVLELFSTGDTWQTSAGDIKLANEIEKWLDGDIEATTGRKIVLIQPYYDEDSCSQMEQACKYITDKYSNFSLDILREVTVETFMHLDDYDIIIYEGHGGYSEKKNSPFLCFPVPYPVINGIVYYNEELTKAYLYADFFEQYYKSGDFKDKLFYLGSCCSTKTSAMSDAIMKKGAAAVVGFSATVGKEYCHDFAKAMFENLCDVDIITSVFWAKMSVGTRDTSLGSHVDWVRAIGGKDPTQWDDAYYASYAEANCITQKSYTLPTTGRTYKLPGAVFAANYKWSLISEYNWNSVYTFDIFIEDASWFNWTANCSTDSSDYIFYFNGKEGDPSAIPIGVMITTPSAKINYFDSLYSGTPSFETDAWLENMYRATADLPISVYAPYADETTRTFTLESGDSGNKITITLMYDYDGILNGILFVKGTPNDY